MENEFIIKSCLFSDFNKGNLSNHGLVFGCLFSYFLQEENTTDLSWNPKKWFITVYKNSEKRFKFDSKSKEYLTFDRKLKQAITNLQENNYINIEYQEKEIVSLNVKGLYVNKPKYNYQEKYVFRIGFTYLQKIITECDGLTKGILPVFLTILFNINKPDKFEEDFSKKIAYVSIKHISKTTNISETSVKRALRLMKCYHIIYWYTGGQYKKNNTRKERYENLYALYENKEIAERYVKITRLTTIAEDL